MIRLAFLASNAGTSLRAIIAAIEAGDLAARACLVVSNKAGAPALAFARSKGVPALWIPTVKAPEIADARLMRSLQDAQIDWVILSGYLRKLGPLTLARYEGRILNIHPALLPRHGGPGLYGRRVHEAVLAAGDTLSGASVHLVDGEYDHGEVIARVSLPILPGETAESLERRVMQAEPALFIETLQRISDNIS